MKERIMPRDVQTRWNSTYDMLKFALKFQDAVNKILGERAWNMREYELSPDEWKIASQLRDVLKARFAVFAVNYDSPIV